MGHDLKLTEKEIMEMADLLKAKRIEVKYFGDQEPLVKTEKGDMIDLRSAVTVKLKKDEYMRIPLGVAIKLPEGMTALVMPRSSTFEKFGIIQANGVGVIDNSYCGNLDQWQMPVIAMRDTVIHRGDRICQFGIFSTGLRNIKLVTVDKLEGENREGFGSTGVN